MIKQATSFLGVAELSTRLKQAELDLDAEQIADILWLALQMGEVKANSTPETQGKEPKTPVEIKTSDSPPTPLSGTPVSSPPSAYAHLPNASSQQEDKPVPEGIPFKAPAAPALRNPLALARALRPLMRKVPSPTKTVLDEEETVTQIAEKGIWIPVVKPAPERWLDLALVVEEFHSTVIWQEIIAEFQKITEFQGAFRYVRIWSLTTDKNNEIKLCSRRNLSGNQQRYRSENELLDPAGKRLILLVSDCISPLWREGKIHQILKDWSNAQPLAILQLLPERLWTRTALGAGFPVQLSSLSPGIPNNQLIVDDLPVWQEVNLAEAVILPVVTLEPSSFKQWSRVVAGVGSVRTAGIVFDLDLLDELVETSSMDNEELSAADLVKRFRSTASHTARRLAGLMTVVPVSLPVVYLIQETLLKESMQVHVAEVFMSGLLCRITSDRPNSKGEIVQYKFVDGVKELLLNSVPIPDVDAVLEVVSRYIARKLGVSIKNFTALLSPKADWSEETKAQIKPFAEIAFQVLRHLGGEYAALARHLERSNQRESEFQFQKTLLPTVQIEHEIDKNPKLGLRPFKFEIATIEINEIDAINTNNLFERVDEAVFSAKQKHLDKTEKLLIEGVLANQTYEEIAALTSYSSAYLGGVLVPKLWKLLSEVFGEKVTKKNLKQLIEQWVVRSQLTINRRRQQAWGFSEDLGNEIKLEMVAIPEGSFMMGSPEDESERIDDESPQHQVTVKSFFMGKYPVTQAQWKAVAALPQINRELNPKCSRFDGDNRPVEQVSWYDVVEFCDRLSQYSHKTYRLPSEAEWEYACRAVTTTPFHFGETITTDLANYNGNYTYGNGSKGIYRQETTPVGSFQVANAFGLYDMHGNVWEWCADHWHDNYEGAPSDGTIWLSSDKSSRRLLRGGSWGSIPAYCRSAYRIGLDAGGGSDLFGFRVGCAAGWTL